MDVHFKAILSSAILVSAIGFSNAHAVIDVNAAAVELRDPNNGGCTVNGAMLDNCFTSITDLTS